MGLQPMCFVTERIKEIGRKKKGEWKVVLKWFICEIS